MKVLSSGTKIRVIGAVLFVVMLIAAGAYAGNRIISDSSDNSITFITNSNGGHWDVTDDNLQLAINDLSNASGTVWLGDDMTTDRIIKLWNNTILDLCGFTITLDSGFYNVNNHGAIEIGNSSKISRNNTIRNGVIVGNNYSSYPTTSGNNANIYGVYSYAVMQNCTIQNMRFTNLIGAILLEGLGTINGNPGRGITIKDIWLKDIYVGIQTYSNAYEYCDVIISGVHAENIEDDVVAVVGHWGGVVGATPYVRNVIVENIQVYDKNTLVSGAVVKLDAGDATGGGKGVMSNIIVRNVNAYTSVASLAQDISVISLLKGSNTERLFFSNIIGRGEWTYGFTLNGRMEDYYIINFALNARYGISLFSTRNATVQHTQCILISNGYLAPITSRELAYSIYGMGIVLAAGTAEQGLENLRVENVHTMWLEYPIYEGVAPPSGVQGIYKNNSYNLDVGNQNYSNLSISSEPVDLNIYKRGMQIYSNFNRFGNTTDYIDINETGYLTLHGDARVTRHADINAGTWVKHGLADPGTSAEGLFCTLDFDKATNETVYYTFHIPWRRCENTDIEVQVKWFHDTNASDAGKKVMWGFDYVSIETGETVDAINTTITQLSAGNHNIDAGELISTTFTTKIVAGNLANHDTMGLRFYRVGTDSSDDLDEDARMISIHLHFTMDKLGEPIS